MLTLARAARKIDNLATAAHEAPPGWASVALWQDVNRQEAAGEITAAQALDLLGLDGRRRAEVVARRQEVEETLNDFS